MIFFICILLFLSIDSIPLKSFILTMKVRNGKNANSEMCTQVNPKKIILHKIENNECGDCEIKKKYAPFAISFTKLEIGSCKDIGYTIPNGKTVIKLPIIGKLQIKKFLK